jgi:hypothetical protein
MSIPTESTNVVAFNRADRNAEELPLDLFLEGLAEQVRRHSRSSTSSIIAIGKALIQAKERIEHGQFTTWVGLECGFTIRSAQHYMRASELAAREGEIVSLLNPAALYRLSAPNTPPDVITRVVEMLHLGFVPTEAEIVLLIVALAQPHDGCEASKKAAGDQETFDFARELHSRLGQQLVSKLISSSWPNLRKHLRDTLGHPQLASSRPIA